MRITVYVNGYIHWEKVPPGTLITDEHKAAKLAKQHTNDDDWHMRTRAPAFVTNDKGEVAHHHDTMLSELSVADRFASLVMINQRMSRPQVVADLLQKQSVHHHDPDHVEHVVVHDGEPVEELIRLKLSEKRREFAMESYRRFHALKVTPPLAPGGTRVARKDGDPHTVDTWPLPTGHVLDEKKLAEFEALLLTDETMEATVKEYMTIHSVNVEQYLNVVLNARGGQP